MTDMTMVTIMGIVMVIVMDTAINMAMIIATITDMITQTRSTNMIIKNLNVLILMEISMTMIMTIITIPLTNIPTVLRKSRIQPRSVKSSTTTS